MPTPNFTLQLTDAQSRIERWQYDQGAIKNALASIPNPNPLINSPVLSINAFTFELHDLCQLFERIFQYNNPGVPFQLHLADYSINNPINAVRFYLGEKDPADPGACLIGVGVVDFQPPGLGGQDVISQLPVINNQPENETSIYDFSYPCPTTCPTPGQGIMNSE